MAGRAPLFGPPQYRPLQGAEQRPNPDGSYSTEITMTAPDAQGQWEVYPSLWMPPSGRPVELPEQAAQKLANMYEQFGYRFPRFNDLQASEDWSTARSHQGGVGTGPLAQILSKAVK